MNPVLYRLTFSIYALSSWQVVINADLAVRLTETLRTVQTALNRFDRDLSVSDRLKVNLKREQLPSDVLRQVDDYLFGDGGVVGSLSCNINQLSFVV